MTKYTILIVEDESIPAHYIKKVLKKSGHMVIGIARDSQTALHYILTNSNVDLVMMDIKINGKHDGIALAKKIQLYLSVAILFTTGYTDEMFLDRAKEINSIGYLVKPIQAETLLSTIEVGMSHFQKDKVRESILICKDTIFNQSEQSIKMNSSTINLSSQETLLLKTFLKQKNLLFSTQQLEDILEKVSPLGEGALRTTLWRLRKKLPKCITIENIYNLGYKIKILS